MWRHQCVLHEQQSLRITFFVRFWQVQLGRRGGVLRLIEQLRVTSGVQLRHLWRKWRDLHDKQPLHIIAVVRL